MNNMVIEEEIRQLISGLSEVFKEDIAEDYKINILDVTPDKPHKPNTLQKGEMGIYIFKYDNIYLKIGRAGPNNTSRFSSQHYRTNPHIPSTLAKSMLKDTEFFLPYKLSEENIGDWIKQYCQRIEIIFNANEYSPFFLPLVEAALHYKYQPRYEGGVNKRNK